MITTPTVFILGAGASCPYNYPTGRQLREYICDRFPSEFAQLAQDESGHPITGSILDRSEDFAAIFKDSSIPSIDQWLALNPDFSDIGKIAITFAITKYESKSKFNEDIDPSKDWYRLLYERMTEGFSSPDDLLKLQENKVSFITFNYDRSLENYLYTSVIHSFWGHQKLDDVSLSQGFFKVVPFKFIHIYGQIDNPPWEESKRYGTIKDFKSINRLKNNIRVIGDRQQEKEKERVSELIAETERVFFLGFGYSPENMEIFYKPNPTDEHFYVYGTGLGLTERELANVTKRVAQTLKQDYSQVGEPLIEPVDCYRLLREYL